MTGYSYLLTICAFAATATGVGLYRQWSLRREVFDMPNERSSHSVPTPRGGGLVIVLVAAASYLVLCWLSGSKPATWYLAGAALIAGVSLVDDLKHVPAAVRFVVHGAAAAVVIGATGGFWFPEPVPRLAGWLAGGLWIVWMTNAYNFMDGIDGIAGIQAVSAGFGWAGLAFFAGAPDMMVFGIVIAVSGLGFLIHNWAPARIFMGDVGAAFLGFTFAVMPLIFSTASAAERGLEVLAPVPIWFFLFDSVVTFSRRAVRGERVWRAHREHLYQRLVIAGMPHARVSAIYGVMSAAVTATAVTAFGAGWWIGLSASACGVGSAVLLLLVWRSEREKDSVPARPKKNHPKS